MRWLCLLFPLSLFATAKVKVGLENLFTKAHINQIKGKNLGLITNQTAITSQLTHAIPLFKENASEHHFTLKALFSPEHGIDGSIWGWATIENSVDPDGIPIYSLWGKNWRPTEEMLEGLDLLIFDIQDIGSRSYTYITTLFFAMEEAAKHHLPILVCDRPNPINGLVVDGPMVDEKHFRSRVGYINIPYCHGMTIGELAHYFNEEYHVGCELYVVPMTGWKRDMTFSDTGLFWVPTSQYIPHPHTPLFYPITGIIGELRFVNTGVGYTLPFQLIGAPFVDGVKLANHLNAQKLPGVHFTPHHWKPMLGRFKDKPCQGVLIHITDHTIFAPVTTAYTLLGLLKSLYPKEFTESLLDSLDREEMFCKVNGTASVLELLKNEKYVTWKLRGLHQKQREAFANKREKYLLPCYSCIP